jgi:hypothetical protein
MDCHAEVRGQCAPMVPPTSRSRGLGRLEGDVHALVRRQVAPVAESVVPATRSHGSDTTTVAAVAPTAISQRATTRIQDTRPGHHRAIWDQTWEPAQAVAYRLNDCVVHIPPPRCSPDCPEVFEAIPDEAFGCLADRRIDARFNLDRIFMTRHSDQDVLAATDHVVVTAAPEMAIRRAIRLMQLNFDLVVPAFEAVVFGNKSGRLVNVGEAVFGMRNNLRSHELFIRSVSEPNGRFEVRVDTTRSRTFNYEAARTMEVNFNAPIPTFHREVAPQFAPAHLRDLATIDLAILLFHEILHIARVPGVPGHNEGGVPCDPVVAVTHMWAYQVLWRYCHMTGCRSFTCSSLASTVDHLACFTRSPNDSVFGVAGGPRTAQWPFDVPVRFTVPCQGISRRAT